MPHKRFIKRWGWDIGILSIIGLAIPLALSFYYGAAGLPLSDDWAYDKAELALALHGHMQLYHWGVVTLLGQLILTAPFVWIFGGHISVMNIWDCAVGFVGLVATNKLIRNCGLSRKWAIGIPAALGLYITWIYSTVSYMTDGSSYAFAMLSLAMMSSALPIRDEDKLISGRAVWAVVLGFVAFTIREQSAVAILAVFAVLLTYARRRRIAEETRKLGVYAALTFVLGLGFYVYRRSIPSSGLTVPPGIHLGATAQQIFNGWVICGIGLFILPVVMYLGPARMVRRAWHRSRISTLASVALVGILPPVYHLTHGLAVTIGPHGSSAHNTIAWLPPISGNIPEFYGDPTSLYGGHAIGVLPVSLLNLLYALGQISATICAAFLAASAVHLIREHGFIGLYNRVFDSSAAVSMVMVSGMVYTASMLFLLIVIPGQVWPRYLFLLLPMLAIVLVRTYRSGDDEVPRGAHDVRSLVRVAAVGVVFSIVVGSNLMVTAFGDSVRGGQAAYKHELDAAHALPVTKYKADTIVGNWTQIAMLDGNGAKRQPYFYQAPKTYCYNMNEASPGLLPSAAVRREVAGTTRTYTTKPVLGVSIILWATPTDFRGCHYTFRRQK